MTRLWTTDWSRRATLGGLAAGAGAAAAGFGWQSAAAEPPPETTRIRLLMDPAAAVLCWAPQYLALDFLRLEGFTDIARMPYGGSSRQAQMLTDDALDLAVPVASDIAVEIDRGAPVSVLGGLHLGCIEVFASEQVESINDLKGRRLLISGFSADEHILLSVVLSYVGLDPADDVTWVVENDFAKWPSLLASGGADVVNAFPSMTYDIHELGIAHVILNTTLDDPWRHYYCCMIAVRSEFVERYPVATKRALRAFAKAQDLCATDREGAARRLVELGATDRFDYARRLLSEIPYGAWRDYDPAASLRFYALRLREAGLISSTPSEILERGTDFSFLDELRREIKL